MNFKKTSIVFLVLLISQNTFLFSQNISPKTYTIVSERTVKLNGGARATIGAAYGAKSRTFIEVTLPPNTIEWHYSFSTSNDGSSVGSLNLSSQLANLLLSFVPGGAIFRGLASNAVQTIKVPPGAMAINTYVFDANNITAFINKQSCAPLDGTYAQNTTQGEVQIKNPTSGTYYLGLQNISSLHAVLIKIEVVAIVSQ